MEEIVPLSQRIALSKKPSKGWPVMYQKWRNLLFLHWEYDAEIIAKSLPKGLYVDTYQDKAYIGIVPFEMRDVRPRFLPAVPGISNLLELNLRTYVYDEDGIPGVWFYSLDANKRFAVYMARYFFHLSYYHAKQHISVKNKEITFNSLI